MKHYFQTKLEDFTTIVDFGNEANGSQYSIPIGQNSTSEVAGLVHLPSGVLPYWSGEDAVTATPKEAMDGFLSTLTNPTILSQLDWGTPEWNKANLELMNWNIQRVQFAENYLHVRSICGGFEIRRSKSGRLMCEVQVGASHRISMKLGAGDRSWNNWIDRVPDGTTAFGIARPESNGGGCWVELLILPIDGEYRTLSQKNYEQEVL
jgi:hypothetical protein